ncbi:MAG TPA: response regulator, partial [Pyrinomonadaceae bacterium]|nr:response regulator [Pyrinomonadaceae bacterium]
MANIIIVDDEQSYRQLLTLVFEEEGHDVRTAMNGRQALEAFAERPAEVIVSDVKMPDMDGIEMLRAVRETQPDVGVVLMTAFASVDTAREAFKLGADDFITKPFDVEELKLIVRKTLEKQELIAENQAFKRAQRERGSVSNIIGTSAKMQA